MDFHRQCHQLTDSKMFFLWKSRLVGFQSFVYWLLVLCTCKVRRNYFADILRYFTTVHQQCMLFYFQLSAMQGCTCVVQWCVQLLLSFCKSRKILAKKYILGFDKRQRMGHYRYIGVNFCRAAFFA